MHHSDLLSVDNLRISTSEAGSPTVDLVKGVSFALRRGTVCAIVGESGSGKSLTAAAILGLLDPGLRIAPESRIALDGKELTCLSAAMRRQIRGKRVGMVFQEPGSCLNPVLRVGHQIAFPLRTHLGLSRRQALVRAEELLDEVGMPDPRNQARAFPHELSGGLQQRVMIAAAIACGPELLIGDEPTSALDVAVQGQILNLLARLRRDRAMTMLLISHDLSLVAKVADSVVVYHEGEIKEQGRAEAVLRSPQKAYTRGLVEAGTHLHRRQPAAKDEREEQGPSSNLGGNASNTPTALEARSLSKTYTVRTHRFSRRNVAAVRNVSFSLRRSETLGVVGESGSGKTTLAMCLLRLIEASSGQVLLHGRSILDLPNREVRLLRRRIQMVFQDPYASLNPRKNVLDILTGPMRIHGLNPEPGDRELAALKLLDRVGLPNTALSRHPQQFSGGERQRIAIARALAVQPDILVCDEAVSALDASVQVQILDLLRQLQRDLGMAYVFISHDLSAVSYMADRLLVMLEGAVVERGETNAIYKAPAHPYTAGLLAAERTNRQAFVSGGSQRNHNS